MALQRQHQGVLPPSVLPLICFQEGTLLPIPSRPGAGWQSSGSPAVTNEMFAARCLTLRWVLGVPEPCADKPSLPEMERLPSATGLLCSLLSNRIFPLSSA